MHIVNYTMTLKNGMGSEKSMETSKGCGSITVRLKKQLMQVDGTS